MQNGIVSAIRQRTECESAQVIKNNDNALQMTECESAQVIKNNDNALQMTE
jgi:hypothetical protein